MISYNIIKYNFAEYFIIIPATYGTCLFSQ